MIDYRQFEQLETELKTFELRKSGIPLWERLRFHVFSEIDRQVHATQRDTGISKGPLTQLRGFGLWIRNLVWRNPFLADQSDLLFVGHPRRKQEEDGYWWDIYCDPLHESLPYDTVHFEGPFRLRHYKPARTSNLRYLDAIKFSGTIQRKLGLYDIELTDGERARLAEIEAAIESRFGANLDLQKRVVDTLRKRRSMLWLYERLLERVDPAVVVVVVSYGKETLIEACKRKGIPVVELQHGIIQPHHMGYSFPGNRTKEMFPDYLFTFGEFWADTVEFPLPEERVISVGYPYLQKRIQRYETVQTNDQVLFLSQGTIGTKLSKFTVEVAENPHVDSQIVYKLHPSEYGGWQEAYPWLVESTVSVVDDESVPLYRLFAESAVQVGVYTTALFEGLAFGLNTYIAGLSGSEVMQPLVERGFATPVDSPMDFVSSLSGRSSGCEGFDVHYFFEGTPIENIEQELSRIIGK